MGFLNELLNVFVPDRHQRQIDNDPRWAMAQRFQYRHQEPKYDEQDRLNAENLKRENEQEAARGRSLLF